jgi:hypothetical protein
VPSSDELNLADELAERSPALERPDGTSVQHGAKCFRRELQHAVDRMSNWQHEQTAHCAQIMQLLRDIIAGLYAEQKWEEFFLRYLVWIVDFSDHLIVELHQMTGTDYEWEHVQRLVRNERRLAQRAQQQNSSAAVEQPFTAALESLLKVHDMKLDELEAVLCMNDDRSGTFFEDGPRDSAQAQQALQIVDDFDFPADVVHLKPCLKMVVQAAATVNREADERY